MFVFLVFKSIFSDNFPMALYSFEGVNDQWGVMSWAVQETGMLPLLSCDSDKTAWLKHKEKGSGPEKKRKTW